MTAFVAPLLFASQYLYQTWLILSAIRQVFWHVPLMVSGDLSRVLGIGGNIAFQFLVLWPSNADQRQFSPRIWHTVLNTLGGKFFPAGAGQ
ncbi:MAG: hypothetical protein R2932_59730 [Caldilineaceae bacterium]